MNCMALHCIAIAAHICSSAQALFMKAPHTLHTLHRINIMHNILNSPKHSPERYRWLAYCSPGKYSQREHDKRLDHVKIKEHNKIVSKRFRVCAGEKKTRKKWKWAIYTNSHAHTHNGNVDTCTPTIPRTLARSLIRSLNLHAHDKTGTTEKCAHTHTDYYCYCMFANI